MGHHRASLVATAAAHGCCIPGRNASLRELCDCGRFRMAGQGLMRIVRLLRGLWLWRWTRSAVELLYGVWVHPTAKLLGSRRQIHLSRGTVVGARTRMMAEA